MTDEPMNAPAIYGSRGARIEDVAKLAKVSTGTVSRALRGLPNVSDATRRAVLRAAQELNYVVSPSASSLASGHMSTIGVITPYVSKWFFGQVLAGIQDELAKTHFDMTLYVDEDGKLFESLPMRRRVDGVLILTLPPDHPDVSGVAKMGIPVGTLGDTVDGFTSVGIDDVAASRAAVNHLIGLGHRRIAMVTMDDHRQVHYAAPQNRSLGYAQALEAAGIAVEPELVFGGGFDADGGEQAAGEMLALAHRPTAVFAQSDELAMGVLHTLRRAGLRCPEDVSVIGFDDTELASMFDLTTVAQPAREQGRVLARQMMDQILKGAPPTATQLPTRLVIRGTTAPIASAQA